MTGERRAVRIVRGGPMLVTGVPVAHIVPDACEGGWHLRGETAEATVALCRCGRSGSMPRCDREPPYVCFDEPAPDPGAPAPKDPTWTVPDPTRPSIGLRANGPARVAGDVPVTDAGGHPVPARDGRLSLCRCGVSRHQPICDGSHKAAGFADPSAG